MEENKIRNFCIIAHIDHGKSTLADRFLEITGTVLKRDMKEQLLDQMDIERERGITIKLQPVQMKYYDCTLNLIDTPGHVDFTYEVSRSLACVEGAILVVDAAQGVEAQTLSNLYLAMEQDLKIIPVINKIDLPNAEVAKVEQELISLLNIKPEEILKASAKNGKGVEEILQSVIKNIPPPQKEDKKELQALIFDSEYDSYQGVIAYVRVMQGELNKNDIVKFAANNSKSECLELGVFKPKKVKKESIKAGEIGYIVTGLRDLSLCQVGDTIINPEANTKALPGYKPLSPMIFASIYPQEASEYTNLKDALEKLVLNDSSLSYETENSKALGYGYRCGFLGLLHMEIVQERLEREYNLELIITAPSVTYKYIATSGEEKEIKAASELPNPDRFNSILEPWVRVDLFLPKSFMGPVMELVQNFRGEYKSTEFLNEERAVLTYEIPLASIVTKFYDQLKSVSKGYASMNYEIIGFREGDLVRLDILVAEEEVSPLSSIVPKNEVADIARNLLKRLKTIIPKQNFVVALQGSIWGRIIAREDISALRKDVTAKLYGGDVTRKRKLLEKQKKGKKRMKHIGRVDIPQDAFLSLLKK
ncbi:MAG: translation elongation factor 4 [bacterium]